MKLKTPYCIAILFNKSLLGYHVFLVYVLIIILSINFCDEISLRGFETLNKQNFILKDKLNLDAQTV